MIVAIMQPYFFPYIGYFQLIKNVDVFVYLDDVQYIKGGWVNRNRILKDGEASWITLPVLRGGHALAINQRRYHLGPAIVASTLRVIEERYRKAPNFREVYPIVQEIMACEDANIATFNSNLIDRLAAHLDIKTLLVRSSELIKDNHLAGQERIIALCRHFGATRYVNPIGGITLYQPERFARAGLDLSFLESTCSPYAQFGAAPVPSLSIIDELMFNARKDLTKRLEEYRLVRANSGASALDR
jgi:hypothetical protein